LIPINVCFGSHEDKETNDRLPRVDDKIIMSWNPARFYSGKEFFHFRLFQKHALNKNQNLNLISFKSLSI